MHIDSRISSHNVHIDVELIAGERANTGLPMLAPIATEAVSCRGIRTLPRFVYLLANRFVHLPVGQLTLSVAIVCPAVVAFAKLDMTIATVDAHPVPLVPFMTEDSVELDLLNFCNPDLRPYSAMLQGTLVPPDESLASECTIQ